MGAEKSWKKTFLNIFLEKFSSSNSIYYFSFDLLNLRKSVTVRKSEKIIGNRITGSLLFNEIFKSNNFEKNESINNDLRLFSISDFLLSIAIMELAFYS